MRRKSWTQSIQRSVSKIRGTSWKSNSVTSLSSTTKSTRGTTMTSSSSCPTGLGQRTNPTILKEGICQTTGDRDAPLQCFGVEQDSLKKDGGVVKHEMVKCGSGGGARMEKRTRKEAEWKLQTRRDRSLMSRAVHFAHGAAQRCPENCRGATDSVHYRVWCKDKSPNVECSETVEVLQNAENRKGGRCPCRDALAFHRCSKQEKGSLSPSESLVKNQIACLARIVLCERRLGRKNLINVVSSPLPSFLFCFLFL